MLKQKSRVQILVDKFTSSVGLPFQKLLPASTIEAALVEENLKYRNRIFSPIVTLWAFLSQVLDNDKSCHNAVSRIIAWLAAEGLEIPSEDNSAYCQARVRLPEKLLLILFGLVGKNLEKEVTEEYLWCGRHVKVVDGSTVSMPDTPSNQQAYPQPSSQKAGCGFPLAKIGVLFSIATGSAIAVVIEVFRTHDVNKSRKLYEQLNPGDVLLGDRAFCSYADMFFVQKCQCDAVIRKHQGRKTQMKKGKRIGHCDRLIVWHKPKSRPKGLSKEEFLSLPKNLLLREVHYYICIRGYRSEQVTLITTLLDAQAYPLKELLRIYELRWDVELDLKHVKTTLGMEVLRVKTPEMVRKEIYVHLLAYNLLRTVMWSAGTTQGVNPLRISLQGARQHLNNFGSELKDASIKKRKLLYQTMLTVIAHKLVPERKGRAESRVRKRRPLILSFNETTSPITQSKSSLSNSLLRGSSEENLMKN